MKPRASQTASAGDKPPAAHAPGDKPFRVVTVVIRPRERKALELPHNKAADAIRAAFGGVCVSVVGVQTDNASWRAACVIDARKAPEAALLYAHPNDERLWRTFIESGYSDGSCDVVDMEAAASATPPARVSR